MHGQVFHQTGRIASLTAINTFLHVLHCALLAPILACSYNFGFDFGHFRTFLGISIDLGLTTRCLNHYFSCIPQSCVIANPQSVISGLYYIINFKVSKLATKRRGEFLQREHPLYKVCCSSRSKISCSWSLTRLWSRQGNNGCKVSDSKNQFGRLTHACMLTGNNEII